MLPRYYLLEGIEALRVVFYGTPHFAVPTLQRLIEAGHEIVAVVTQPDKPTGRGKKIMAPPVKVLAEEAGLKVLQPVSLRKPEGADQMAALDAEIGVVVAYGKILPKNLLDAPKHGCLNVHASLLPAYRGAAPIQWAIIKGETQTGVTIMQMEEGLDTGPMIARREVPILDDDTAQSMANMLSLLGADLLVETLKQFEEEGSLMAEPQDDAAATLAPLIRREMARLDWEDGVTQLHCAVRGFYPWPKAFTTLKGSELKIIMVEACDPSWVPQTAFDERVEPGTVVDVFKGRGFVVRTGVETQGVLLVTRVQPPGKPEMSAYDFVNGAGLEIGDVLGK